MTIIRPQSVSISISARNRASPPCWLASRSIVAQQCRHSSQTDSSASSSSPSLTDIPPPRLPYQLPYSPLHARPHISSSFLPPAKYRLRISRPSPHDPYFPRLLSARLRGKDTHSFSPPSGEFSLVATKIPLPDEATLRARAQHKGGITLAQPFPDEARAAYAANVGPRRARRRKAGEWELRLLVVLRIKELHRSAVMRTRLKKRVVRALKMVAVRGAKEGADGEVEAVDEEAGPEKWFLPGYTYVFHPTLSLNLVPFHKLVTHLRTALFDIINTHARALRPSQGRTPALSRSSDTGAQTKRPW